VSASSAFTHQTLRGSAQSTLALDTMDMSGAGTVPSTMANDSSAMPNAGPPSYPPNKRIRRLAARTGAQLPFNNPPEQ
jgi:hypothetical protein